MNMIFKSNEECSQCEEVKERVVSLQYDQKEDGESGEFELCAECLNNYIKGKIVFV